MAVASVATNAKAAMDAPALARAAAAAPTAARARKGRWAALARSRVSSRLSQVAADASRRTSEASASAGPPVRGWSAVVERIEFDEIQFAPDGRPLPRQPQFGTVIRLGRRLEPKTPDQIARLSRPAPRGGGRAP